MANDATQETKKSLREVRIFAKEETLWGIPSRIAIGSAGFTFAIATQIPILFALAMGGLLFGVLFTIYADDPRALEAWKRSLGRPVRWSVRPRRPRSVTFLPFKE